MFNAILVAHVAFKLASQGYEVDGDFATSQVAKLVEGVTEQEVSNASALAWELSEAKFRDNVQPFTAHQERLLGGATLYFNALRRAYNTDPKNSGMVW